MRSKLVCLCNMVTDDEIKEFLRKGATTTKEVQELTRAGTTCGRCLPEIDALLEEFNKNHPGSSQYEIEF